MAINRDVDWSYTAIYSKFYSNKIVSNAKKNIKFNNSSFISINITIIGCRKNGNNCRKILHPIPFIHFITFNLCFMSSNNKIICFKKVELLKQTSLDWLMKWTKSLVLFIILISICDLKKVKAIYCICQIHWLLLVIYMGWYIYKY